MHPRVLAALSSGDHLIARHEALDLGVSPATITHQLRSGAWVAVRRGVYADGELWRSLDPYVGRQRLRTRAVLRTMQRTWVLSHDTAAHELGMAVLSPPDPTVHVTRPGYTTAWTRHGVSHHLAAYRPSQVVQAAGLPALDLARTAVDIARDQGELAGVVACDAALRMGVPRYRLEEAYAPMTSWPHVTVVRSAVELADGGAQNVHESLGRMLVLEAGRGEPETQFPLMTSEGVVWCDLRIGNHVIETDGRVKYRSHLRGGVAAGEVEDVIWDEKKRERLIRAEGLGVSRILWADHWEPRRSAALSALRTEIDLSTERYGPDLPDRLVKQAAEIRARALPPGARL